MTRQRERYNARNPEPTSVERLKDGWRGRATAGALVGFAFGACFLGIGIVGAAVSGVGWSDSDGLWSFFYVMGAAASGGVAGILKPLATSRLMAAIVGMIAFQPLLLGIIAITEADDPSISATRISGWAFMTLVFGPLVGWTVIRDDKT